MSAAAKQKVVIVEDERVLALDLKWSLERLGYQVLATVSTGAGALHAVDKAMPDVILMDLRLQGSMDGAATALELRRRGDFTLIIVSGSVPTGSQLHLDAPQIGHPDGWLPKPFTSAQLEAVLVTARAVHRAKSGQPSRS
jgi:CheY-like chemotaxis protein